VRVLVLHSEISPDAPADEQDTLLTIQAVVDALESRGHQALPALFTFDPERLRQTIAENRAAAPMALAGDKPLAKRVLRLGGLPTPDWGEPPFDRLENGRRYIVKSATEDASLGLDDAAVVTGPREASARAEHCRKTYGGRWFAEAYVHGREFNVSVIEKKGGPRVLPIPEMTFLDWDSQRPRLVGYAAKWEEESPDCLNTVRKFVDPAHESALCSRLAELSLATWHLFGLQGFARVDFRVDTDGNPYILELNPNPCLEPGSGLAAAAGQAGMSYADLVEQILMSAVSGQTHSVA
jgi:D-alanine-D-alanine ligase